MNILLFMALPFTSILAAAGESTTWLEYMLQGGPFAIVVALIVMDKLASTSERDRLRLENDVLRGEIKILNESIRADIVPPLVQINGLMKDVIKELNDRGRYSPGSGS